MTVRSKASLTLLFEQGDVPTGTNYADMIDSSVNMAETSAQSISGPINPTELITARVSAGTGVYTGTMTINGITSAADLYANTIRASAAVIPNMTVTTENVTTLNATTVSATTITGGSLSITGMTSSVNLNVAGVASVSALNMSTGVVSAAGTTQGAAAPLIYSINFGMGVADGATTGFAIPANQRGRVQYITNGGASANLWPPTGGQINVLASNAAFPMAANIPYIILHTFASGYAVK